MSTSDLDELIRRVSHGDEDYLWCRSMVDDHRKGVIPYNRLPMKIQVVIDVWIKQEKERIQWEQSLHTSS